MSDTVNVESSIDADSHGFDIQLILDTLDLPAFALDETGRVIAWDQQIADLLGGSKEEILGVDNLGQQFYGTDQRNLTLAEKVVEEPQTAHRAFDDVDLADGEYTLLSGDRVYEDTSVIDGTEIWFICAPVYRGNEFVGVIEIVQDLASSARYQRELQQLFTELIDTIAEYEAGNFTARVNFDREDSLLDEEFLRIVANMNEMGRSIQNLVEEVIDDAEQLQQSADDVARNSQEINEITTDQATSMETISSEVANLSATVEEIASTTDTVVETSNRAADLAEAGDEAATEVIGVMEDVSASADEVAADVDSLQTRVDDIDEIVEVINDIAEQTNILALNASIEAARAGEAGEGFAVVADEVKSLAEESQKHAGQIEEMVQEIQSETNDTVRNLETTTDQIDDGITQVEDAMDRFDAIVEAINEATDSISQVSDATDDQAASAEEIASMVDEAVDQAETVSKSIDNIVANTEEQAAMVEELNASVSELTDAE